MLAKYSSLLSLTVSGITALQWGVAAAATLAAGYAVYRYFTSTKDKPASQTSQPLASVPTEGAFA